MGSWLDERFSRRRRKKEGIEHPYIQALSRYVLDNWKNLPDFDEWISLGDDLLRAQAYFAWLDRYESYMNKPWKDSDRIKRESKQDNKPLRLLPPKRRALETYWYPTNDDFNDTPSTMFYNQTRRILRGDYNREFRNLIF